MTHKKWFLLGLTLALLFLLILLVRLIQPYFTISPSDVSGGWRRHHEKAGEFEIWLPREWRNSGSPRTTIYSLPGTDGGSAVPVIFSAFEKDEWITVQRYDTAFDLYTPSIGEKLAHECSRNLPVSLTLSFDGIIYLDAANIVTIEQDENGDAVAYQSAVLRQVAGKNLVRTVACVVGTTHVYLISMDTIEAPNSIDISIHERILRSFRILR